MSYSSDRYGNPVAAWRALVDECSRECNGDRFAGMRLANKRNPQLREAARRAGEAQSTLRR